MSSKESPPPSPEYTGVFDLPNAVGLTASERILTQLCRRSFLSLWTLPNLHTDEGFRGGAGSAKEFVDVLLVFGDDVVFFSDKHITFSEEKPVEVSWPRWYKRAVLHSARQLYGALHWLQRFPERIFLDPKCTRPLPVELPSPERARYHLVAVTRGTFDACSKFYAGDLGTLPIRTDIVGKADPGRPFSVGLLDPDEPFVHILDEFALEVILQEFDTTPDFIQYLNARERLLNDRSWVVIANGEEQLVAAYLLNLDEDGEHWFTPPFKDDRQPSVLMFDESFYAGLRARPEYRAKKEADAPSYAWDEMIEQFIKLGDPAIVGPQFSQGNQETEKGLRLIASESRFRRRMLVREMGEALSKAAQNPGLRWWARTIAAKEQPDRVYIFLIFPKSAKDDYEEYRKYRVSVLHAYCRCAKVKFPTAHTFIGIATDHPLKDYRGGSEDLFVYHSSVLTEEERNETEKYRQELGILADNLELQDRHDDEFPRVRPTDNGSAIRSSARDRAREEKRRRKAKRKMANESRRRNRRRK